MQLKEAVALIRNEYFRNQKGPSVWADLGCGSGLFTRALCHYLKPGSLIYAVDKMDQLELGGANIDVEVISLQADFETDILPIGKPDGILMANSLHYIKDKHSFLAKCGRDFSNEAFIIVEYDTDMPVARWVPYPVSFSALTALFQDAGFNKITKLSERPSSYGRSTLYAALIK